MVNSFAHQKILWVIQANNWFAQSRQARKELLNLFRQTIDRTGETTFYHH